MVQKLKEDKQQPLTIPIIEDNFNNEDYRFALSHQF
jgi:hypothetical protein